jgi:hypothetical protein
MRYDDYKYDVRYDEIFFFREQMDGLDFLISAPILLSPGLGKTNKNGKQKCTCSVGLSILTTVSPYLLLLFLLFK